MKEAVQPRAPERAPSFGGLLRRAREAAGLTQEELAERAGLSVNAIGALERGSSRHPYPATVRALAAALGLNEGERERLLATARRPARSPADDDVYRLPAPRSSLIGREREIAEVVALLCRDDVSIVTLTGPGGAGKTRLALSAAAEYTRVTGIETVFVNLAALREAELVLPTVARAFGILDASGAAIDRRLNRALRDRQLLLLHDNFEQVIEAASELSDVLAGAPGVTTLITSRERLRIDGEVEYIVAPLALPPRNASPSDDAIRDAAAVRLFIERARTAGARFDLTSESARAILEICRRVDGLPLAIELAAARTRLLSPAELLDRMEERLPLLTGGNRDAPPRQQTMRDTIAWSYALLDPEQQRLFRLMAVFAGGATLDAIEAVAGRGALGGIEALHLRSLLIRGGSTGAPRFGMLETICEFATEQLSAADEEQPARRKHFDFYAALVERAAPEGYGPHPERLWQPLELEIDNLRAALDWAMRQDDPTPVIRLSGALIPFWTVRGHIAEGRAVVAEALAREGVEPIVKARAVLHDDQAIVWAFFSGLRDDLVVERAQAVVAEALAVAQSTKDRDLEGAARLWLATLSWLHDREADALTAYEEALAVCRSNGQLRRVAWALCMLGSIYCHAGDDPADSHQDLERAGAYCEEALGIFQSLGDRSGIDRAKNGLGYVAYQRGDLDRSRELNQGGLKSRLATGYSFVIVPLLRDLADIAVRLNEPSRAARLYGAADVHFDAFGFGPAPTVFAMEDAAETGLIREALGDAAYETEYASGHALTLGQAVEEALAVGTNR